MLSRFIRKFAFLPFVVFLVPLLAYSNGRSLPFPVQDEGQRDALAAIFNQTTKSKCSHLIRLKKNGSFGTIVIKLARVYLKTKSRIVNKLQWKCVFRIWRHPEICQSTEKDFRWLRMILYWNHNSDAQTIQATSLLNLISNVKRRAVQTTYRLFSILL